MICTRPVIFRLTFAAKGSSKQFPALTVDFDILNTKSKLDV